VLCAAKCTKGQGWPGQVLPRSPQHVPKLRGSWLSGMLLGLIMTRLCKSQSDGRLQCSDLNPLTIYDKRDSCDCPV